jgi:hypothetical protein
MPNYPATVTESLVDVQSAAGHLPVCLPIDPQSQSQTQWCWAAITAIISSYFESLGGGIARQQCEIVQNFDTVGHDCCANPGACNKPGKLDESIDFVRNFAPPRIDHVITASRINAELQANNPVAVRVLLQDGGEHAVLIYGGQYQGFGEINLLVWDPAPARGHRQVCLRNWYDYIGGWQNTYFTKPMITGAPQ